MTKHSSTRAGRASTRRSRVCGPGLLIAALLFGLIGCSATGTTSSSSPSCVMVGASYAGHSYRFSEVVTDFEVTGRVGSWIFPPCDDANPGEGNTLPPEGRRIDLYRVAGLDPEDGIAIRSSSVNASDGYELLGRTDGDEEDFTPTFERFVDAHRVTDGTPSTIVAE